MLFSDPPVREHIPVQQGTGRIKIATTPITWSAEAGPALTITVRDAAGNEIARSATRVGRKSPATVLDVDLSTIPLPSWGDWTVEITNGDVIPDEAPVVNEITVIATFAEP